MKPYYMRHCEINIGGHVLQSPPMAIQFEIEFALNSITNAKIKITNPGPTTRKRCETKGSKFTLQAGYAEDYGTILAGEIITSTLTTNGTDQTLELVAADASKQWLYAKISKT